MKKIKTVLKMIFALFCFITLLWGDSVDSHMEPHIIAETKVQAMINQQSNQ